MYFLLNDVPRQFLKNHQIQQRPYLFIYQNEILILKKKLNSVSKSKPFLYLIKYRFNSAIVGAILNERMIKQSLSAVSTYPCGANN